MSNRVRQEGRWVFGRAQQEHNHDPNLNPFLYEKQKDKQDRYGDCIAVLIVYRGATFCTTSAKVLPKERQPVIARNNYHNLRRQADHGIALVRDKGIAMAVTYLEDEGLHLDVRAEYVLNMQESTVRDRGCK